MLAARALAESGDCGIDIDMLVGRAAAKTAAYWLGTSGSDESSFDGLVQYAMHHHPRFLAHLTLAFSAAGCLTSTDDDHDTVPLEETYQELNLSTDPGWGAVLSKQPSIEVCFFATATNTSYERGLIREAIRTTWEAVSQVRFTGWGTCTASATRGIRIELATAPDQLGNSRVGTNAVLSDRTMLLPTNWSAGNYCGTTSPRARCIEAVAVHEFGHALGFEHEQARNDTPSWCTEPKYGTSGIFFGAWDAGSVMNYCRTPSIYAPTGALLSANDAAGTAHFYGSRDDFRSNLVLDPSVYLDINPDLVAAFGYDNTAATNHWIDNGPIEGRSAHTVFDVRYYLSRHSDLRNEFGTNYARAIRHWVGTGIDQGRRGSVLIDAGYYLQRYSDLRAAFGPQGYRAALEHYRSHGLQECRRASADFDPAYYLANNVDVRNAYGASNCRAAALHYQYLGRSQGRRGAP